MSNVFRYYGKVYRTGGDAFVVISSCDETKTRELIVELEEVTENWKGKLVDSLAISVGAASHQSYPECSILQLMKIADDEMYKNKNEYYLRTGRDRRKI